MKEPTVEIRKMLRCGDNTEFHFVAEPGSRSVVMKVGSLKPTLEGRLFMLQEVWQDLWRHLRGEAEIAWGEGSSEECQRLIEWSEIAFGQSVEAERQLLALLTQGPPPS